MLFELSWITENVIAVVCQLSNTIRNSGRFVLFYMLIIVSLEFKTGSQIAAKLNMSYSTCVFCKNMKG